MATKTLDKKIAKMEKGELTGSAENIDIVPILKNAPKSLFPPT